MMLAWGIPAPEEGDWARFVRALGKNRYVVEVDHRVHFAVDRALASLADKPLLPDAPERRFREAANELEQARGADPSLDLASRDPRLWRPITADELAVVFRAFWHSAERAAHRAALRRAFDEAGLAPPAHEAWQSDPDELPFPELLRLDWVLLAVDELDPERHAGALSAMEDSGDEAQPGVPLYAEGPTLTLAELTADPPSEILVWCDGPYTYADYLLRGVAKAAKLAGAPVGARDLDENEVDDDGDGEA